jgi:ABC-type uncharacterized transport system substrate-binding protein
MIKRLLNQFLVSCFDNPKSKIQNRKLVGIVALVVTFVTCGVVATAQQPKKVHQIGYLSATDAASDFARSEAIRLALRAFGYVEGQNIATHYRYAEGKQDRLPELAAELVRLKVDIIVVAAADRAIRAAKNATKTIPIVMVGAGLDPVEAGYIESLARPGGNLTGLTNFTKELGGKRLELLKEVFPKLARVAVLYDPGTPDSVHDVLCAGVSDAGGLISYATSINDLYRRAAIYMDRLLKWAKPGDLPVEQPTRFELVINLKTAKQIGVTIPPMC